MGRVVDDSRPRTGPHEIGLIACLAAKIDEDAARRLYRKYRSCSGSVSMCSVTKDWPKTFIKFCRRAGSYGSARGPVRAWLFTMARTTAYDIARRPSSRPFLPSGTSSCRTT